MAVEQTNATENTLDPRLQRSKNKEQRMKSKSHPYFLWWCSGAQQDILEQMPTESTKYAGIGGAVLGTWILATFSGGYAIFTVFNSYIFAIVLGIIWGLLIFNIDRFLVSTMRKYEVPLMKQFGLAFLRLILALFIGLVISRPLELRLFDKEINNQIITDTHIEVQSNNKNIDVQYGTITKTIQDEIKKLEARRDSINIRLKHLETSYIQESDGTGGSGNRGFKKIATIKKDAFDAAQKESQPELQRISNELISKTTELSDIQKKIKDSKISEAKTFEENAGFLAKNKALSNLIAKNDGVYWTALLITLLIIIIEILPILSKLIIQIGPYDVAIGRMDKEKMSILEDGLEEIYKKRKESRKEISNLILDRITIFQKTGIKNDLDDWENDKFDKRKHGKRTPINDLLRALKELYDYNSDLLF
jgi:Domain of unknown function (DUF4407)